MLYSMVTFDMPPTQYALRMRPLFIAMLSILMCLVVCRFAISDFWGALSLTFVVLMGYLVISTEGGGLNASHALYYGVMVFVSGLFDVALCAHYFMHSKYAFFAKHAPMIVLFTQSIFVICPFVEFASALLSYSIFRDAKNSLESQPLRLSSGYTSAVDAGAVEQGTRPREQDFQMYQGQPHRLGRAS